MQHICRFSPFRSLSTLSLSSAINRELVFHALSGFFGLASHHPECLTNLYSGGFVVCQLALLTSFLVGKLIDIDNQVVSQCHLLVKLVGKVDVVEEIHPELGWQKPVGESGLSAPLTAY